MGDLCRLVARVSLRCVLQALFSRSSHIGRRMRRSFSPVTLLVGVLLYYKYTPTVEAVHVSPHLVVASSGRPPDPCGIMASSTSMIVHPGGSSYSTSSRRSLMLLVVREQSGTESVVHAEAEKDAADFHFIRHPMSPW
jgi:hypothetical protein